MQNKLKKISLSISFIVLLIFCSLFLFLFREIKNNIKISKESEVNLQKELVKREEMKNFDISFKTIKEDKDLFETHFVQSSDIVPFLNKIEKMASSVGIKTEVSLIEVSKDNTGLLLEMKVIGSFSQIYKFLTLLENSSYELEFISVDMRSLVKEDINKKNIKKIEWEANLKIKLISFL